MTTQAIVWFRRDLRLNDNPAWASAGAAADRVTALYVLDPALLQGAGEFRRSQLFAHLHGLDGSLRRHGGRLMVRRGTPEKIVPEVAGACGATLVCANADVTPYARRRDGVDQGPSRARISAMVGQPGPPSRRRRHGEGADVPGLHPICRTMGAVAPPDLAHGRARTH